jgi:V/A-type H+/Na+-transporting ATPase subunit I
MFQPVPMAKVAIVGPKQSLAPTVDALHRLNLLHIEDFNATEDKTFDLGSPLPGGSKVSERLVRVRGVMKGANLVAPQGARPFTIENLRALEEKLREVEDELARLVEERGKADDEVKLLAEEDATLARIQNLGIQTRLLTGYKNVATVSGFVPAEIDLAILRAAHKDVEILESPEAEGRFIVAFAPREAEKTLAESASKLGLTPFEVPAHDVPPAQARERVARKSAEASARRDQLDQKIASIRERHGAAFFALDEYLSIEADKATSPVRFRTTAHSFMIEGWIPHDAYTRLEQAVNRASKNTVYLTRLQRAALSHKAPAHHGKDEAHAEAHGDDQHVEDVPVMLKNPNRAGPYELLTDTYSRPKYGELDPTLFMFIGFPFFFGMMLGDIGYGIVLLLMLATGAFNGLYKIFGFQSKWHLNKIFLHSAISTILFGCLYTEFFGFELFGPEGLINHYETHFGIIPYPLSRLHEVKLLLALSLLVGVVHLFIGLVIGMRNAAADHGMGQAIKHRGSWLCILAAVALAGFAVVPTTLGLGEAHAEEHAADEHVEGEVDVHQEAVEKKDGKTGLLLWAALGLFIIGTVLLVMGEGGIALLELPTIISNLLSYTRLVAIGLSGVGIALAGNKVAAMLMEGGLGGKIGGVVVMVIFHTMGVLLGILGPALHALRLHYVEFFTKFYTGGGTPYAPFGAHRKYTVPEVKQA